MILGAYVVGGITPLVGSPMANRSYVTGQTKSGSQGPPWKKETTRTVTCSPRLALPGPHLDPGARPGVGACRKLAPGGQVFAHGTRPGSARNGATWAHLSDSSTTGRKVHEGPVQCGLGSSRGRGPSTTQFPGTKTLAIGTWNVTSLGGKEPELVWEVEMYRLEIVGLTSTHSLGSGTQLLERGWTLHLLWSCPGLVNERVASLHLRVGDRSLAVVCAYGPEQQYRVPGLLGVSWEGYLIVLRLGDSIVLLGDFNAHVGNDSDTWRRIGTDPEQCSVIGHGTSLSITTVFHMFTP
ncbi:hypothetical protein L3Q82_000505 [Scortum barcoo]|uniref:Uncharacterized protein n=1 Tax=Scortum barcoo TaxID=214431 RepID=A0ACB8WFV1_9TELE|nr:hypothetical protein L3Q82_000505 [Scortum barcoo]